MPSRALVTILIAANAGVLLSGCSASLPAGTVTAPAPTVTVTVAPTLAPDPADPLTALDAWMVCYGFLTRYADREGTGFVIPELHDYDPKWVAAGSGGYEVQLSSDGTGWGCHVSGTVAAPHVDSWTSVP